MIWNREQMLSLLLAVALDICIGDPSVFLHPIVIMGKTIALFEQVIRKYFYNFGLKLGGFILVFMTLLTVTCFVAAAEWGLSYLQLPYRICIRAFLMSFMLAARSLRNESMKVYDELKKNDLEAARNAVARIVGRDVQSLDKTGVVKASVETVAENFSDGILAPFMYMFCFGFIGGVVYKAINTMDSMLGYKNEKYIELGFAAAKIDDLANFFPSRISALFMILASAFGFRLKNAVKIFFRDRHLSTSPNSGQTEAACAGALGVQLLGDAYYFGALVKKPTVGDALREIETKDIKAANRLNEIAYALAICPLVLCILYM